MVLESLLYTAINQQPLIRPIAARKFTKSYGQCVQYGLFECALSDTQYAKLRSLLHKLIKLDTDSIRFYFLCACCFGKIERIDSKQPRDNIIFFAECADG